MLYFLACFEQVLSVKTIWLVKLFVLTEVIFQSYFSDFSKIFDTAKLEAKEITSMKSNKLENLVILDFMLFRY